jgi:hypothetical protein
MTAIYEQPIDHPSAWTSAALGSREALSVPLGAAELDAVDELLARTRHLAPQQVTRAEFDHPVLDRLLARLKTEIMDGRGIVIIRGVTPERYTEEQFQRIYWGIGTHLGIAAVQSALGDRLGYVENKVGDQVNRGYRGLGELHMHTDSYEIVGLMSVRKALEGGQSAMVSSLSIHNEILRERPDLLPALYRGFYYASEEARFSSKPVTDEMVPVFTVKDGILSCIYEAGHMRNAAAAMEQPLPTDLAEALDFFSATARRDDLALSFTLEPGEMMIWHNYTNLHSRTAFKDDPASPRRLLRLWLTVPDGRPVDPSIRIRAETYERIYREARERAAL